MVNDRTTGAPHERNHHTPVGGADARDDDDAYDLVGALCDSYRLSDSVRALVGDCDDRAVRRAVVRSLGFPVLGGTVPRSVLDVRRRDRAGAAVPGWLPGGTTSEALT